MLPDFSGRGRIFLNSVTTYLLSRKTVEGTLVGHQL